MGSLRAYLSSLFISRVNATIHTAPTSNASPLHRSCADYSCKWDCSPSQQFTTERASNTPILPAFLIFPRFSSNLERGEWRKVGPGLFRNFSRHQPGVRSFPNENIRGTSSGIQSDQIFLSASWWEPPQLPNRIRELCEHVRPSVSRFVRVCRTSKPSFVVG